MSDKTLSERIFDKFTESIAGDPLFDGITDDLVAAMHDKQGKIKIKDLLRKTDDAPSKP
ncbi:MAG: hypothetical protein LBC03_05935 [Nitrososphaerota archaeon]|jgi:hypothetical protein|nr:hypothetical protein [Nitrososphaerota archaeon]